MVWPFGALEQHGPHLPLITDTFFAEKILEQVLSRLPSHFPLWKLPPQSIGFSPEHASFPGTLSLSAPLLISYVNEIGQQIASMGFDRLVFFNAHGGQIGLLQAIARQLRVQCPSMAVLPCFLWSGVDSIGDLLPDKEVEEGLHAGLAETSLMMHLASNLVGEDRPKDGATSRIDQGDDCFVPEGWSLEGAAPCAWLTNDLSKTGVIGDSTGASESLGTQLNEVLVAHWVRLLTNLMSSNWPPVS